MRILFSLLCVLTLSTSIGCSKKMDAASAKYTIEEFDKLASESSLNKEKSDTPQFSDYSPGVNRLESKSLIYERLAFFAIAFENEEQARKEAIRLNQYYARNWLFDRVQGEPLLEDYVILTFKAMNPTKKIQRVPIKSSEHASGHGEGHEGPHH